MLPKSQIIQTNCFEKNTQNFVTFIKINIKKIHAVLFKKNKDEIKIEFPNI